MATTLIAPPDEPAVSDVSPAPQPAGFAPRALLTSASTLIVATGMERGFGFLANLLAARWGGAAVFGGYSLAMTTANNIAAYAGAGIGSTATRFSGEHPAGSRQYRAVARALLLVSAVSAVLASLLLFAGADPLARVLLQKQSLQTLLRWASLSAGAMILFECCRGFLVGQRRLRSLLIFSGVMGMGMILLLPAAAHWGSIAMVCTQAAVACAALAAALLLPAGGDAPSPRAQAAPELTGSERGQVAHMAREVWRFGFVQLLGIVGLNAAGWWMASLVARSDSTLVEMGLFAVANQVRNIIALVPGLLTQSSYALMANESEQPGRVLVFCTWTATLTMLVLGGGGVVVLPWLLPLAWGPAYTAGVLAGSLALCTAMVHMSGSAAAARLTILSLPVTGVINAIWSIGVIAVSLLLLTGTLGRATAAAAMLIYLLAHTVSAALVLIALRRLRQAPPGLTSLYVSGSGAALLLAGLSFARTTAAAPATRGEISALEIASVLAAAAWVMVRGKREGLSVASLADPLNALLRRLPGRSGR